MTTRREQIAMIRMRVHSDSLLEDWLVEHDAAIGTSAPCSAIAEGAPKWPCQLGAGHAGPAHIHADARVTFQWANGEDGYVPEECPDPDLHEDDL